MGERDGGMCGQWYCVRSRAIKVPGLSRCKLQYLVYLGYLQNHLVLLLSTLVPLVLLVPLVPSGIVQYCSTLQMVRWWALDTLRHP